MPRSAYTENGEAKFVRTDQPLPVIDTIGSLTVLEAITNLTNEMKLINARIEEAFQTGINKGDV